MYDGVTLTMENKVHAFITFDQNIVQSLVNLHSYYFSREEQGAKQPEKAQSEP